MEIEEEALLRVARGTVVTGRPDGGIHGGSVSSSRSRNAMIEYHSRVVNGTIHESNILPAAPYWMQLSDSSPSCMQ